MTGTKVIKIDPRLIGQAAIIEAARVLEKGGLVVFPTETVYGIAANLLHKDAMERLTRLKERPADKQFSIHLSDKRDVEKYAINILPRAYKVIERFWPGPLTLVLPAPEAKSVGLRMPKNDIALQLLRRLDFPVVAPSANFSGRPAPRDADTVVRELSGHVDLILDAGPTELGSESTVLDARALPFTVLREGALKKDDVLKTAQAKTILFVCTGNSCRSVMAQYLLKKKTLESARQDIEVMSAGTFAFLGMSPTRETQRLIQETGLDAAGHRAQKVTPEMLRQSDLVLVMERRHKEDLVRHWPEVKERVHVLGEFVKSDPQEAEIPDPIGKSEEFYHWCFSRIRDAVDKLWTLL